MGNICSYLQTLWVLMNSSWLSISAFTIRFILRRFPWARQRKPTFCCKLLGNNFFRGNCFVVHYIVNRPAVNFSIILEGICPSLDKWERRLKAAFPRMHPAVVYTHTKAVRSLRRQTDWKCADGRQPFHELDDTALNFFSGAASSAPGTSSPNLRDDVDVN